MAVKYAIMRDNQYLQGVEPNVFYSKTSTAPTMGNRHTYSEFFTVWGPKPVYFERMTAANYIKTLFEEYRWGSKKPIDFKVLTEVKTHEER